MYIHIPYALSQVRVLPDQLGALVCPQTMEILRPIIEGSFAPARGVPRFEGCLRLPPGSNYLLVSLGWSSLI